MKSSHDDQGDGDKPRKRRHKPAHTAHHEEGEEGEGPWLMSFADMVTLLMCFFILFFQTEKVTKGGESQKALSRLKILVGAEVENQKTPKSEQQQQSEEDPGPTNDLDVVFAVGASDPNTVEIVLLTQNMFRPGVAVMTDDGVASLKAVARQLELMPKKALIEVEGHTDNDPVKKSGFTDNWGLSTARAAAVVRELAKAGVDAERMRASGMAHFHPLVPETDERGFPILSNKSLNRRIVIKVRTVPLTAGKASGAKAAPKPH